MNIEKVSEMHNVAIIGYGKMGKIRKEVIDSLPNCQVKWICDPVKIEGDFNHIYDPAVIFNDKETDSVFICTPNCYTKDLVIRALNSQKHVFSEKPCGTSVKQVEAIMTALNKNPKRKLMIGFNHRWHKSVAEAKRAADSGKFGEILWMRGRYGKSVDSDFFDTWRAKREYAHGGILMDQGIHMLDLFLMFCDNFEEVRAFCSDLYWHLDIEDNVFAIFRNSKGQVASLHSTMTQWRHLFSFEVFLEHGYIVINGLNTPTQSYGEEELSIAENRTYAPQAITTKIHTVTYSTDDSFQKEMEEFYECIDNDSPINTGNIEDALKVVKLIEKIYNNGN